MNIDDSGQAFPFSDGAHYEKGMSLRDYFAAAALQGELACQDAAYGYWTAETASKLAELSYVIADAMLAARQKGNKAAQ